MKPAFKYIIVAFVTIVLVGIMISSLFAFQRYIAFRNTRYSPEFSWRRFKSIYVGMTKEEVHKEIGDPLYIYSDGKYDRWIYSMAKDKQSDYFGSEVRFSPDEARVVKRDWELCD